MIVLIIIGSIGSIAAWIIGPSKGLLVAAEDGVAPKYFAKRNKHGVPTRILILQAFLVSVLAGAYSLMPSLEGAYVLLTAMTTQLSLIVYIGLFIAAIKLKKSLNFSNNFSLFCCCGLGLATCFFVILLGFVPPELAISSSYFKQYVLILIVGMFVLCLPPLLIIKQRKNK
jgi:amino acid transporter